MTFTCLAATRTLLLMRHSAAVLCHDKRTLPTLSATLEELDIDLVSCPSQQEALELVMTGRCSTLIVDFDLPGAEEVIRMAALLPESQKPALLAVASRAWPGTGQAFQSGASRILYRPLEPEQLKDALKAERKKGKADRRKSTRRSQAKLLPQLASISASMASPYRPPSPCLSAQTWHFAVCCRALISSYKDTPT